MRNTATSRRLCMAVLLGLFGAVACQAEPRMDGGQAGAPAAAGTGAATTTLDAGTSSLPTGAGVGGLSPRAGAGGAGRAGRAAPPITPEDGDAGLPEPVGPPRALPLTGSLNVHDPSIIRAGETYYLFSTGTNVPVRRSSDLMRWQNAGTAFSTQPGWMAQSGIAFDPGNSMWAPDVSLFGGTYHLYYSVSSFGQNDSCIGHATRAELDQGAWADRGSVLCSKGRDYNAIDPHVVLDDAGVPWMSFGSFWTGIKLVRLTAEGTRADDEVVAIAGGRAGPNAIEAPVIVRRDGQYHLFVSFDSCCRGADSTYKLAHGRAASVLGPYLDRAGKPLLDGGGSILLRGSEGDRDDDVAYAALGHNSVLIRGDEMFNVYHAYRESDGVAVLRIAELRWSSDGWPISAGP